MSKTAHNHADLSLPDLSGDIDLANLVELAQSNSSAQRSTLYRTIWDLFEHRVETLNPDERSLMLDILQQLSHDVEMSIRTKLADRLAKSPNAPQELIVMLANDDIALAYPILVENKSLQDADLIEVVRHRTAQHQLAVAVREHLSPEVSSALIDTDDDNVIVTLLQNESAEIAPDTMGQLVERSRMRRGLQKPLLQRQDLSSELAGRMYSWVSEALKDHIVNNFNIDPETIEATLSGAVEEVQEHDAEASVAAADPYVRLVDKLHYAGELTPGFALKALQEGHIELFELAIAKLAGMSATAVRRLVYQADGQVLAIICRCIGIDRAIYLMIFELLRRSRGEGFLDPQERNRLKDTYNNLVDENARIALEYLIKD